MTNVMANGRAKRSIGVDPEQLKANARISAFTIVNSLLRQQRTLEEGLGMSGNSLVVYMTVALATVQKLMRQSPLPDGLRTEEAVPLQLSGSISRRAIAATSGLSREAVRRTVDNLIADGRLMTVGRNAVCTPPGTLSRDAHMLAHVTAEVARSATVLLQFGVLTLDVQHARSTGLEEILPDPLSSPPQRPRRSHTTRRGSKAE